MTSYTGLEFVGWTLLPGKWITQKARTTWHDYAYLVGVEEENTALRTKLEAMSATLAKSREEAAEVKRLRSMLAFEPPEAWSILGARVVSYRLGPHSALDTIIVDRGAQSDIGVNTPAVTQEGVIGKVMQAGPFFSSVLLITDLNSRMSVMGQTHRTQGILLGKGFDEPMNLEYVPLNAPLVEGEILITSGLDGIFPKGLPVAKVISVQRSEISLFLSVQAELLLDMKNLEEVLLLKRSERTAQAGARFELQQ